MPQNISPIGIPNAPGFLENNGSGTLSWATVSSAIFTTHYVNDVDYPISSVGNQIIVYTSITATRAVTLPLASTCAGEVIIVGSEMMGPRGSDFDIAVHRSGSDTIAIGRGSFAYIYDITSCAQPAIFISDGNSQWILVGISPSFGVSSTQFLRNDGTWAVPPGGGGGSGNVTGPASSIVGDIALFNNTLGTVISDSGTLLASLAPLASPQFTGDDASFTANGQASTTRDGPSDPYGNGCWNDQNLFISRLCNYSITGGQSPVSSVKGRGIRIRDVVLATGGAYENGIYCQLMNYAANGQQCSVYAESDKFPGAGPTWGAVSQCCDATNASDPTTEAVGHEIDISGTGTDANMQRIGLDIVGYTQQGAKAHIGAGLRIGPQNEDPSVCTFDNGVYLYGDITKPITILNSSGAVIFSVDSSGNVTAAGSIMSGSQVNNLSAYVLINSVTSGTLINAVSGKHIVATITGTGSGGTSTVILTITGTQNEGPVNMTWNCGESGLIAFPPNLEFDVNTPVTYSVTGTGTISVYLTAGYYLTN